MSDILYIGEHTSCRHYVSDYRCCFRYLEFDEGDTREFENVNFNYLGFILEGQQLLDCNEFKERLFNAGDMVFVPKMAKFVGRALKKGRMLICMFDVPQNICNKFNLQSYWPICKEIDYDFRPVGMSPQMAKFIDSLVYFLQQGISCEHFHEMKQQEMLLILRWFYTREQIAELFYPIIGCSLDFKALILENYNKVANVSELASLSHMSRSSFDEAFKKEFGIPAGKWLLQRKAQDVLYHMSRPGATLSDIMIQFDFSSPSHMTRFCKQHFGRTPSEIMQDMAA
ncbi:MAG: AraC family transcriptional regulator [Alistipes sp.]|jgi:AraC-like DNA-binding protein|nr:AraC family transcriptional regulator [Alistipes sp.]